MLKNDVILKIIELISLLKAQVEDIKEKRRTEDNEKNYIWRCLYSVKNFFHDELQIKNDKISALKELIKVLNLGDRNKLIELRYKYAQDSYSQVFCGINNRTEGMFNLAAAYFDQPKLEHTLDNPEIYNIKPL